MKAFEIRHTAQKNSDGQALKADFSLWLVTDKKVKTSFEKKVKYLTFRYVIFTQLFDESLFGALATRVCFSALTTRDESLKK